MEWIITGAVIFVWLISWIHFIGPDEMGILVKWGRLVRFLDSGFCLFPRLPKFLEYYIEKRPKTRYNLDYPAREVITMEGDYNSVHYGAQVVKVDAVAYLSFPRQGTSSLSPLPNVGNLFEIIRSQVPVKKEELLDWTEESVLSSLRVVFGGMTWKEATESMDAVRKEAERIFKDHDALRDAGFGTDNLSLGVEEIKLPPALERALVGPDEERLKKEAATFVAERQSMEWVGMVMHSFAQARGKTFEEIQAEIEADEKLQREFLDYAKDLNIRLEGAERGAYLDIRTEGSEGIEKSFLNLIAAWQRMPTGDGKKKSPQEEETTKGIYRDIMDELE